MPNYLSIMRLNVERIETPGIRRPERGTETTTQKKKGDEKKKHPTAHDQKPIIPRLTPFWPLNGPDPSKRLPAASNWAGS